MFPHTPKLHRTPDESQYVSRRKSSTCVWRILIPWICYPISLIPDKISESDLHYLIPLEAAK